MKDNKCKENVKKDEQSGITLVSLVVTIVVLLILAGISLKLVLDKNGIIKHASEAKNQYEQDEVNTEIRMSTMANYIKQQASDGNEAPEPITSNITRVENINSGSIPNGTNFIIASNIYTEKYKQKDAIEKYNDENLESLTLKTFLELAKYDTNDIVTESGEDINVDEWEAITPWEEIFLNDGTNNRIYSLNQEINITIMSEGAKVEQDDERLILFIEQGSNKIRFLSPEDLEGSSGTFSITLKRLGVITIMEKISNAE